MRIDINTLFKEIHFPIVQGQPSKKPTSFIGTVKAWATFKRMHKVTQDYILWCEHLGKFIFIPEGFIYDKASVPKLLNSFFKSDGMLALGALPHDFGYKYRGLILLDDEGFLYLQTFSQRECDEIMEQLCVWESGLPKSAKMVKKLLNIVGRVAWKKWKKKGLKVFTDFEGLI